MNGVRVISLAERERGPSLLYYVILFIGLHSVLLGGYIYFFTNGFYRFFFSGPVQNVFFVKQSGVFLICLGVYYLLPLINLRKIDHFVSFTVFSKIVGVLFFLLNAQYTLAPMTIYYMALGDALMALALIGSFVVHRREPRLSG